MVGWQAEACPTNVGRQEAGESIGQVEGDAAVAVAEGLAADPHDVTGGHQGVEIVGAVIQHACGEDFALQVGGGHGGTLQDLDGIEQRVESAARNVPSRTTLPGAFPLRAAAIPAKFAIEPPLTSSPMPSAGYPSISLIQRMHSNSISEAALPLRQPVTLMVYAAAIMLPIAATGVPGEET